MSGYRDAFYAEAFTPLPTLAASRPKAVGIPIAGSGSFEKDSPV